MRIMSFLAVLSLFMTVLPQTVIAAAPADAYADVVYAQSNQLYQPANSVGAPDEVYSTFQEKDASITLDMGEEEEGTGDLTLFYQLLNFGATYRVEFMEENFDKTQTSGDLVPVYQTSTTIDYTSSTPYRYVKITSTEEEIWKLDAVQASSYRTPSEDAMPPPVEGPPTDFPLASLIRGLLVKLVDDGNPATTVDSAVYVIDDNNMRHAFPSEAVFASWYENFDDVAFIDPDHLAAYTLGRNVTVRAGTYLIKITTDPKVYAVEPGGVLRWVKGEDVAIALYGTDWANRVIDVADVFFTNYVIGDPISSAVHPTGTVGPLPSGEVVYVENGVTFGIPGDMYARMRFQSRFQIPISAAVAALYVDGGDFTDHESVQYPY